MLCLFNVTRFPLYLSADGKKILGSSPQNISYTYKEYIHSLSNLIPKNEVCLAIIEIANTKLKRRFLIKNKAFNPHLKNTEGLIRKQFIFPSLEPEQLPTNCYAIGMTLKVRSGVFLPLSTIRHLTTQEIKALHVIQRVKVLNLNTMLSLLKHLNIQLIEKRELNKETIALKLHDAHLNLEYCVLMDTSFKIIETNVCINFFQQLYLFELILLIREEQIVHIYPESGFEWAIF